MPTCQHHDNGSDHNTNDKYKAPRRRQILKCIHLCVCVTRTYIRTYLLPTPPPAVHIPTGWVECHGPYKRERPRSSSASVLSSPPFLGEARKNLSSFFQVFCTQILRDLFDRVGSRRYGRKHAKEIFINNCVQQPAAASQQQKCRHWAVIHDLFLHHLTCKLKSQVLLEDPLSSPL